jgi:hypothetical protein
MEEKELHLTPDELAERWHMAPGSLGNWRSRGLGPRYIKIGKSILYPLSAIEEYERNNTVK